MKQLKKSKRTMLNIRFYYKLFFVLSIMAPIGLPSLKAMDTATQNLETTSISLSESDNIPPDFLEKFSRLVSLRAPCNQHITNERISGLTNLTELDVRSAKLITGEGVVHLVKLERLNMGGWNQTLNDETFSKLTNLTDLDIYGNTTVTPLAFKNCPKLEKLNLWGCSIENDVRLQHLSLESTATPLTIIIRNDGVEERCCYYNYKSEGESFPMGITVHGYCAPSIEGNETKARVSAIFPKNGEEVKMTYKGERKYMFNISFFYKHWTNDKPDSALPGHIYYGSHVESPTTVWRVVGARHWKTTEDGKSYIIPKNAIVSQPEMKKREIFAGLTGKIFGNDYTDYSNLSEITISLYSSSRSVEAK